MMPNDRIIAITKMRLTASFSLSSRSFFNLSLISRSLTTHAAASFAASSGLDLFFNKSGDKRRLGRHVTQRLILTALQRRYTELLVWNRVGELFGQARKGLAVKGRRRMLELLDLVFD